MRHREQETLVKQKLKDLACLKKSSKVMLPPPHPTPHTLKHTNPGHQALPVVFGKDSTSVSFSLLAPFSLPISQISYLMLPSHTWQLLSRCYHWEPLQVCWMWESVSTYQVFIIRLKLPKCRSGSFLWSSPSQKFLLTYSLFALYSSYGILILLLNYEVLESKDGILNILFLSLPSASCVASANRWFADIR